VKRGERLIPEKSQTSGEIIYQLKVTLRHSKPPIGRRLLVPGGFDPERFDLEGINRQLERMR